MASTQNSWQNSSGSNQFTENSFSQMTGSNGSQSTKDYGSQMTGVSNSQMTGDSHAQSSGFADSYTGLSDEDAALLRSYLDELMGGGSAEYRQNTEARSQNMEALLKLTNDYTNAAAFSDAGDLMKLGIQGSMEKAMPYISKGIQGAGTSASSMQALISSKAATDAALSAGALGAQQAQAYGQIMASMQGTVEEYTRPDNSLMDAINQAFTNLRYSNSHSEEQSTSDSHQQSTSNSTQQSTSWGHEQSTSWGEQQSTTTSTKQGTGTNVSAGGSSGNSTDPIQQDRSGGGGGGDTSNNPWSNGLTFGSGNASPTWNGSGGTIVKTPSEDEGLVGGYYAPEDDGFGTDYTGDSYMSPAFTNDDFGSSDWGFDNSGLLDPGWLDETVSNLSGNDNMWGDGYNTIPTETDSYTYDYSFDDYGSTGWDDYYYDE